MSKLGGILIATGLTIAALSAFAQNHRHMMGQGGQHMMGDHGQGMSGDDHTKDMTRDDDHGPGMMGDGGQHMMGDDDHGPGMMGKKVGPGNQDNE